MVTALTNTTYFAHPKERTALWVLFALVAAIRISFAVIDDPDPFGRRALPTMADRAQVEHHLAVTCAGEHSAFCDQTKQSPYRVSFAAEAEIVRNHRGNAVPAVPHRFAWVDCASDRVPISVALLQRRANLHTVTNFCPTEEEPSVAANSTEIEMFLKAERNGSRFGFGQYLNSMPMMRYVWGRVLLDLLDEKVEGDEMIALFHHEYKSKKLLTFHSVSRKEAWGMILRARMFNIPGMEWFPSPIPADQPGSLSDVPPIPRSLLASTTDVPPIPAPFKYNAYVHSSYQGSSSIFSRRSVFSHECVRNVLEKNYVLVDTCADAYATVVERFHEFEVLYDFPLAKYLFWFYLTIVPLAYGILNPPNVRISGERKKQKQRRQFLATLDDSKLRRALEQKVEAQLGQEAAAAHMLKLEERATKIREEDGETMKDSVWKDEEARVSSLEARTAYIWVFRWVLLGLLIFTFVLLVVDAPQVRTLLNGMMVLILDWQATYHLIPADDTTKRSQEAAKPLLSDHNNVGDNP